MNVKIVPSLLAADLSCLGEEVTRAVEGGCDAFHIDVMDWHFVSNLSYGPSFVETVRRLTDLPLDVHLMVDNPLEMIGAFVDAGSDYITIHAEAVESIPEAVETVEKHGVHTGITIRPDTPVETVTAYLELVDLVLVMSVYPGFGGQKFLEESYARIRKIAGAAIGKNPSLLISVDGGVNFDNASRLVSAGANYLVVGTTIFNKHNAAGNIRRIREAAVI
ncbi:ribulose-phosphate 3-epimerase [Candidatus Latescibacterota bacterium]